MMAGMSGQAWQCLKAPALMAALLTAVSRAMAQQCLADHRLLQLPARRRPC